MGDNNTPPKPLLPPKPVSKAPNKLVLSEKTPTPTPPLPNKALPNTPPLPDRSSLNGSSSPKLPSTTNGSSSPKPALPPRDNSSSSSSSSSINLNSQLNNLNLNSTTNNTKTPEQLKRSTMPSLPPRTANYKNKPLPIPNQLNQPQHPDIHVNGNSEPSIPSPTPSTNTFNSIPVRKPTPSVQYNTIQPSHNNNIMPNNRSSSIVNNSNNNSNSVNLNYGGEVTIIESSTPIPVSNHPSLDHLSEFTTMRDMKCKEILTTERTYVDNMKILCDVFIKPLKDGEGGISKELASIICSNIPDILSISIELLQRLEQKLADWSNEQTIGDTFDLITPFLKMYTNYTVGFDNVLTIITDLEKNSTFTTFVQKCTEDPRTRKLDLRSYLIQPVQRITRYHMLLEEVVKHTDQSHPDYIPLTKSYSLMKQVTTDANDAIKKSENRQKVFEIQKMFVTDPQIVAPHREFIFEGTLTKVCRKALKKRYIFLFSDILVYGSSIPPKLLLHEKIELDHCRIEDIPDGNLGGSSSISLNGTVINNAFQICSNKKSFVVFADNADLKMKWMIILIETIDKLKEKRKTIKKEKIDHAEAPVWVPDETADNCFQCKEAFSFVNRRHHCRSCGALVCGKCSENKMKLPITDYKAARVCDTCFETLNQQPPK